MPPFPHSCLVGTLLQLPFCLKHKVWNDEIKCRVITCLSAIFMTSYLQVDTWDTVTPSFRVVWRYEKKCITLILYISHLTEHGFTHVPFKSLCHWLQVWLVAYSRYQCSSVGNQPDWWCSWPSCSFHFVSGIGVRTAAIWGRGEFWDPGCPSFYWLKPHSPHADNCGSWSAALGSAPLISWGSDHGEEEAVIIVWVSGPDQLSPAILQM